MIHHTLLNALQPLANIANAYDRNALDDDARKFWGEHDMRTNKNPLDQIELCTNRGGRYLLTLADCMTARKALRSEIGMDAAIEPLVRIANAYDANELDDDARKFWGLENEHTNDTDPDDIELYQGRGGKRLLTLGDALRAREARRQLHEQEASIAAPCDAAEPAPKAQSHTETLEDTLADTQMSLQIAMTALRDISEGRGMFGVSTATDLEWAMSSATHSVSALEARAKALEPVAA